MLFWEVGNLNRIVNFKRNLFVKVKYLEFGPVIIFNNTYYYGERAQHFSACLFKVPQPQFVSLLSTGNFL